MSDTSTNATNATTSTKPWAKEQNWIKDVLSKSGTELVQLTTNKAVKITKKIIKQNDKDSQNTTMVYYQSTPLIIKSEQPSQAQFCAPLRNTHDQQQQQHQQQQHQQQQHATINTSNSYIFNNVAITTMQHQQNHQQQQQHMSHNNINNTSITQHHQQQQQQYLTNIKTELLPPGITLYATTQPASLTPPSSAAAISITNNVTSSTPTSTTPTTTPGRKTNPNKPQFKCEQCGMTFGSKSAHTSHTKSHAKNGDLSLINGATNGGANSPPSGVEVNEAGVPLGIPKTPQIKPNANAVTNGGDPYQCNVCQKTFAVPARLIRHYRTHTGERPFECEFCHKLFSVKENLQVHRRIHTKERPYKCDVCGRAFEHSGKLHRHMRIHTGERPHKCSVCEKTFIQSGQLVIHMRTHTGEKPYKCPVEGCGKGFTCSKQLKVHSRTHTGEKPYHCDICFRDFGYNHVLKLHRVQHYGSKCYKCTICDETFKSKKEMEAHIKGHANEMPDDDEEAAAAGNGIISTSSGTETISGPNSPQSPSSSIGTTTTSTTTSVKPRKQVKEKLNNTHSMGPLSPASPGSPISSSMSPSSSYASGSRLSAASPTCSIASPTMSLSMEADHHSRDSGVASGSMPTSNNRQLAAASLVDMSHQGQSFPISDEMPTDLSVTQQNHQLELQQQQQQQSQHQTQHQLQQQQQLNYHYQSSSSPSPQHHQSQQYHYLTSSPPQTTELHQLSPVTQQQLQLQHQHTRFEQPTINPALLEAATIASRREDDVQQAAIQIMQLHRSQHKSNMQQTAGNNSSSSNIYSELPHLPAALQQTLITPLNRPANNSLVIANLDQYDDTHEAENLIEHYKRGELSRHGLTKGYAPVPKFEPSLHNNEIILRQVEAAIAPLRSSTESPDRASSPECDSMMLMADRDVMTLPLRKRKLYMSDCAGDTADNESAGSKDLNTKVMRHSSVIQFAKAS